jgi:hypothetical protein
MKRVTILIVALAVVMGVNAQGSQNERFSPERFQAELEQFITKEACLTPQEAAAFFPVYKEMQKKQRAIYDRQRQLGWVKPTDEKGCAKAIRQRDEHELELKRILQTYHNKMLSVLPASKLYDVIIAEDRFHRQKLRSWSHGGRMGTPQTRGTRPKMGTPPKMGMSPGNSNQKR